MCWVWLGKSKDQNKGRLVWSLFLSASRFFRPTLVVSNELLVATLGPKDGRLEIFEVCKDWM